MISSFVVAAFMGAEAIPFASLATGEDPDPTSTLWVAVVYVLESTLVTWLGGGSVGKLLTGLCVVPADGRLRRLNPLRLLGRQVLVMLVVPPLVFRGDGRGLHDLFAGTSTVTLGTLRTLVP